MTQDNFTANVYPSLVRWLNKVLRCDQELVLVALAIAWYIWRDNQDSNIGTIGITACRYVWSGRDIPGVASNLHRPDAMRAAKRHADMAWHRARELRPEQRAILNEEIARLYGACRTEADEVLLDMLKDEYTQEDVAEELGVNISTVYEAKKRLRKRLS